MSSANVNLSADDSSFTMPSGKTVEPLDELAKELALTPEENQQLWRVRSLNRMGPAEYLDFLLAFTKDLPASREISGPDEPFEI